MGEASFESGGYRDARSYLDNAKRQGALSGHSQSLLEWLNSEKAAAPLPHSKALRAVLRIVM